MSRISIAGLLVLVVASAALAQTDSRMLLRPWPEKSWGETYDRIIYQREADVKGVDDHPQVFWWDSTGRFRLSTQSTDVPHLGYRYVTMNFNPDTDLLPDHLDELSAAMGLRLGEWSDGKISVIFGAGYSGDNPFADTQGIFGLAHLLWEKPLDSNNSLVLSIDYDGVSPLLPDVPLPGFAYVHKAENGSIQLGFPRSEMRWELLPKLTLDAAYAVPYTADVSLDYALSKHWHLYAGGSNFFNGFRQDDHPLTQRVFYQMSRAEFGIRFVEPNFVLRGAYFDAAIAIGYAFEQHFYDGFDVRDLHQRAELSDEPYVGLILRGRF